MAQYVRGLATKPNAGVHPQDPHGRKRATLWHRHVTLYMVLTYLLF